MGLSSNTILHTTDKKGLLGILKEFSFKPYYCNEMVSAGKDIINAAFPMISFSDFPVSELKYRFSYGRYGIGLSKSWARKNKLNPVLYVEKKSQLILDYYKQFITDEKKISEIGKDKARIDTILLMLSYMKNYQGHLKIERLKIDEKNYRFSDEREWRFVPLKQELEKLDIPFYYEGNYILKTRNFVITNFRQLNFHLLLMISIIS
jgi:Putative abortive phage resistance protein AbiGi, antitoxin